MIKKILVIHGPNLNLLGEREPGIYGNSGIDVLNQNIIDRAKEQGLQCAIAAIKIPCIEVHISNVFARDEFRSNSVIAPVCKGSISGFGFGSYYLAVQALAEL